MFVIYRTLLFTFAALAMDATLGSVAHACPNFSGTFDLEQAHRVGSFKSETFAKGSTLYQIRQTACSKLEISISARKKSRASKLFWQTTFPQTSPDNTEIAAYRMNPTELSGQNYIRTPQGNLKALHGSTTSYSLTARNLVIRSNDELLTFVRK